MLALDKDTFQPEVLEAKGLVFVDFWSQSCEPCKALMPDVEKLAEKYAGTMKFTNMDTTKARRVAIGQKVLGLPTLAIYRDGEKIEELTKDDATIENIENMIKKYAAQA
ncbi:thioredoxin family protein [Proteiniclasticum sp. QWL-01]|uniref:thioredoxin TrxA n=1 Tax=Proteiniclasticum sp. QWL-01 TaxID=3036945 RepID=UPI0022040E52|nr:thioredoxin family protein [Proteiniclasticum sp. QWL-01]UUM11671.1 thioredoxin family protein [Clostridiaceae bacterium HFYG-1003]WFF73140.1 thioredoxin family protein [Proteiniclasticum sp. QWL-01]